MKTFMVKTAVSFVMLLCFCAALTNAQPRETPFDVPPGESFTVPGDADSPPWWILNNGQYRKALADVKELEIAKKLITKQEEKIAEQNKIIEAQAVTVAELQKGYDHYKQLWAQSDKKLEDCKIEKVIFERNRILIPTITAVGGILTGGLVVYWLTK